MFIHTEYMYTKTYINIYKLAVFFCAFSLSLSLRWEASFPVGGPDPRCHPNTPGIVPLASSLYAHNLWDILPRMAKFQPDKGFGEILQKWRQAAFFEGWATSKSQHTAIQMTSRIFSQDTYSAIIWSILPSRILREGKCGRKSLPTKKHMKTSKNWDSSHGPCLCLVISDPNFAEVSTKSSTHLPKLHGFLFSYCTLWKAVYKKETCFLNNSHINGSRTCPTRLVCRYEPLKVVGHGWWHTIHQLGKL